MLVLGLAGGLDAVHEVVLDSPEYSTYDAAAVLMEDGNVVAAVEQSRLDRLAHSNKFPALSIRACLERRGVRFEDVDRIAYYADEAAADALLARMYLQRPELPVRLGARALLEMTLSRALGCSVDAGKLRFYEHRLTHAASAMHQSGFDEALVYVIDNAGGVYRGRRGALELLAPTSPAQSIERLWQALFPLLGLGKFEEHLAVALASSGGDRARFAAEVGRLYELLPNGEYRLHLDRAAALFGRVEPAARPDLAAAVEHAVETIALHVLAHHRAATGVPYLCMAGGMAENTSLSGRVLSEALFDEVFVHPAAHDSGCAIGAALLASEGAGARVGTVRWGGEPSPLSDWNGLLRVERSTDVSRALAEGALVAWVNGRSSFGSHALGDRNVLVDPRREEDRERVHRALGRRATYRPLAALIPAEDLHAWCEVSCASLPFQTFAVPVRKEKRELLGAALQRDGRARIQTVAREADPKLWALLRAFGARSGVAALASTSFNVRKEPVVETTDDAAASFLCSDLDLLVVGDQVAAKTEASRLSLRASLPPYVRRGSFDELRTTFSPESRRWISRALAEVLSALDGEATVAELATSAEVQRELFELWAERWIVLRPGPRTEAKT